MAERQRRREKGPGKTAGFSRSVREGRGDELNPKPGAAQRYLEVITHTPSQFSGGGFSFR